MGSGQDCFAVPVLEGLTAGSRAVEINRHFRVRHAAARTVHFSGDCEVWFPSDWWSGVCMEDEWKSFPGRARVGNSKRSQGGRADSKAKSGHFQWQCDREVSVGGGDAVFEGY